MTPWFTLFVAIFFEVAGTTLMRLTLAADGVARWLPVGGMVVCYGISLWLVTRVIRAIPIGVTYAVWAGVGTVATAAVGHVRFAEPVSAGGALCIGLILVGVVGLNLTRADEPMAGR